MASLVEGITVTSRGVSYPFMKPMAKEGELFPRGEYIGVPHAGHWNQERRKQIRRIGRQNRVRPGKILYATVFILSLAVASLTFGLVYSQDGVLTFLKPLENRLIMPIFGGLLNKGILSFTPSERELPSVGKTPSAGGVEADGARLDTSMDRVSGIIPDEALIPWLPNLPGSALGESASIPSHESELELSMDSRKGQEFERNQGIIGEFASEVSEGENVSFGVDRVPHEEDNKEISSTLASVNFIPSSLEPKILGKESGTELEPGFGLKGLSSFEPSAMAYPGWTTSSPPNGEDDHSQLSASGSSGGLRTALEDYGYQALSHNNPVLDDNTQWALSKSVLVSSSSRDGNAKTTFGYDADMASVAVKGSYRDTVLTVGASKGHTDIMQVMLENSPEIRSKEESDDRALMVFGSVDHTNNDRPSLNFGDLAKVKDNHREDFHKENSLIVGKVSDIEPDLPIYFP